MSMRSFGQSISQDVGFALRSFRESPVFAGAAVITLALGIAANAAIFSVMNAVVLNSRAFQFVNDADRLAMVWERAPRMGNFFADRMPSRLKDYNEWLKSNRSFQDMAIWRDVSLNLTDVDELRKHQPERLQAGVSSANLFPLLGIPMQFGRTFRPEENAGGSNHVAIINDRLYRSRFGGDRRILGKSLRADGTDYTIVGVLPPEFDLPAMWGGLDHKSVDLWLPMDLHQKGGAAELNNSFVYGRLKEGATVASARADVEAIQKRLAQTDEDLTFFTGINVSDLHSEDVGADLRRSLLVLQAAVGFVLLIACANVANLLLTRAVGREKEMAIRTALGAGRMRLLRQMLTESLLLSAVGGVAGVLLGYWALRGISYLAPSGTHGLHELRMDPAVLLFTLGLSAAAGILFGFAPFFHIRKQDINEVLNRSSRSYSGSSSSLRKGLSILELALSAVLLVGAGLMIRTLATLMSTDLGFERGHLLSMHITLPEGRYPSTARIESFNRQLLREVETMSGIQSVLETSAIPMQSVMKSSYTLRGEKPLKGETPVSLWARVGGKYFETLSTRLLAGRTFRAEDAGSGTSVAVVNQAFAEKNGGRQGVLGKVIEFGGEDGKDAHYRIVGVVANERQLGPDAPTDAEFFLPGYGQRSFYLIARTAGDPLAQAQGVQKTIWKLDGDLPVGETRSMDTVLREWTAPRRFVMSILLAFAGLALVLAAIGLYGVLAYSVTLRTREIGIRVALGAEPGRVARAIVFEGFQLALAGILIGLVAAGFLAQFMQSLIYGVNAVDPLTFAIAPLLLVTIAMVASYLPARRAAGVDPTIALRAE